MFYYYIAIVYSRRHADELLKPAEFSRVQKAKFSQPLCTAIQVALFNKFKSLGVEPAAIIGHSSGEIAAAYAVGCLTMEEAITIAYYRGYVANKSQGGSMAAVGLGARDVLEYLLDGVVVACENSPESSTISGDSDKVREVVESLKKKRPDVFTRVLKVDVAYHSGMFSLLHRIFQLTELSRRADHMKPLAAEYEELIETELRLSDKVNRRKLQSQARFYSSVTGELMDGPLLSTASYWSANLQSPVRFSAAVSKLLSQQQKSGLLLEIGPHSTLAGPLRQILAAESKPYDYVSALTRNKDSVASFLSAVGMLYQKNVSLDFRTLYPQGKAIPGLPTYPWDHKKSYWYESRLSSSWRHRQYPHHCLLGSRIIEGTETDPQWRNILNLEDEPWLSDHKLQHNVVFPIAGYVALAGEAVRQITQSTHAEGYRLRHVVAYAALLLSDSTPTELITSLRRHKSNRNDDSDWYEFSVTSLNHSTWIRHCEGQVSLIKRPRSIAWTPETLPRTVNVSQVFSNLRKNGFVFGPKFRGLQNVTSSVVDQYAAGEIVNTEPQTRQPFTLHPCAIDACLQLLLVANAKGIPRNIAKLSVPKSIDALEIRPGGDIIHARAWHPYKDPTLSQIEGAVAGKLVFYASGVEMQSLGEDAGPGIADIHACSRLQWLPDFDFVDKSTLFVPPRSDREESRLQEELGLLCILETAEKVRHLSPCQPHFAKFRDWLNQQIGVAAAGRYKLVDDSERYVDLPSVERQAMIEDCFAALSKLPKKDFAVGIKRIFENAASIFTGNVETLDVLMQDNVLARIYDVMTFDYGDFVRLLAHTRPNLRILEVGAGTGGTTESILSAMPDKGGFSQYSTYTFTDISASFFPAAKERFSHCANVEFKTFDISKSSSEQGLKSESYDLILGANVVHATPSLQETLGNLRQLLKPDGFLVLTELCTTSYSTNFVFGNFSGWWLGEDDRRRSQPYVSVSRWDKDLKAVGFTGVDTAVYDDSEPFRHFAVMVTRKTPSEIYETPIVTVLTDNPQSEQSLMIAAALQELGSPDVQLRTLGEELAQDQDVICCLDLESKFFKEISEERFEMFKSLVASLGSRRLLWLTGPTQMKCQDPSSAQSIGVARTVRSELGLSFYTVEINPKEEVLSSAVARVYRKIVSGEGKDELLEPDYEFVIDNGIIHIGRYHPFSLVDERRAKSNEGVNNIKKALDIGNIGILGSLNWIASPLPTSLPEHHVEIKVHSCGLNFPDIVYSMGLLASKQGREPLGREVSGTVHRLGTRVEGLAIGDRVMSFTHLSGGFATHVEVAKELVLKIPDKMTFEEAATIQACFTTIVYGLIDKGGLRKGMSVLIHSACGGVGLAALQVARMLGGEVFATVGNEKKIEHLMQNYGIARDRIFSSRDPSFLEGVMSQTDGKGVDLVLNSLSGELLHTSWKCVGKNGTLLELGKRDLSGRGQLDLSQFLDNRSYAGVDVAYLIQDRPTVVREYVESPVTDLVYGTHRDSLTVKKKTAYSKER